jgi:transcriptional regulator with XRE-family HTH domain
MTQENLAERVDTASTYIAMIESGKRTPSFKMIERIAEVLGLDAPELFSMKGYPSESSLELRKELADRFDLFLNSVIREVKDRS